MNTPSIAYKSGYPEKEFFNIKYVYMPNWHDPRDPGTRLLPTIVDYMDWRFGVYHEDWMWREPTEKQKRGER